jgi:hypothetical protein
MLGDSSTGQSGTRSLQKGALETNKRLAAPDQSISNLFSSVRPATDRDDLNRDRRPALRARHAAF